MSIEIENISKQFGSFAALKDVSLTIPSGELVALLGPSGSGKTTLLRIIAGLETADAGRILFDGQDTTDSHVRERQVGFVFQHYALFRHLSVFENIAFGLRVRPRTTRPSRDEITERVMKLLRLVQLEGMAKRYPAQLSGGQRQRIAIARAVLKNAPILILDEATSALDTESERAVQSALDELMKGRTTICIAHRLSTILHADLIVVLDQGKIVETGRHEELSQRGGVYQKLYELQFAA